MKREELKERRTAYRKIYENEDHSMTAEIYLEPVHYQGEDAAKVKGEKTGPSEVLYQNVYEGMDLHCRVCGEKVKEDIVVQDKDNAPSSITYLYQVKKLTPESDRRKYQNTLVPVRFPWQYCITAIWKQPICILTKYPERHHRSD